MFANTSLCLRVRCCKASNINLEWKETKMSDRDTLKNICPLIMMLRVERAFYTAGGAANLRGWSSTATVIAEAPKCP